MASAALEALRTIQAELRKRGAEPVPEGYMTTAEWAKAWSMALSNARLNLKAGVDSGVIQAAQYRVNVGNRVVPTWHFRVVPKKGNR